MFLFTNELCLWNMTSQDDDVNTDTFRHVHTLTDTYIQLQTLTYNYRHAHILKDTHIHSQSRTYTYRHVHTLTCTYRHLHTITDTYILLYTFDSMVYKDYAHSLIAYNTSLY